VVEPRDATSTDRVVPSVRRWVQRWVEVNKQGKDRGCDEESEANSFYCPLL
jgi:hypothetical protein